MDKSFEIKENEKVWEEEGNLTGYRNRLSHPIPLTKQVGSSHPIFIPQAKHKIESTDPIQTENVLSYSIQKLR